MAVSQSLSVTEVKDSVSVENNTSQVRILWTSTQSGDSRNLNSKTAYYYVSINGGAETTYSVTYTLPQNTTKTIVDKTITVPHKDDGTATVKVRTWMSTGISAGVVEKSQTTTLTTIARASKPSCITFPTNTKEVGYFDDTIAIHMNRKSTAFTHKVYYYFGTLTKQPIATDVTNYTYWTIPIELIDELSANAKAGLGTIYVETYTNNGTKLVGSNTCEFVAKVPENDATKPTVATMSVAPVSSLKSPLNTLYVQGHSRVKAELTFSTKFKATVSESSITVEDKNYNSPYESHILNQPGDVSVKATVKDSRGFYGTDYRDIEVLAYDKPYVRAKSNESEIVAARSDASGNLTDSGTYLKIKAKAVWSKLISNGTQYNYAKIKYRYRKEGGSFSSWETILDCKTANSDEVITAPLLNGALDIKSNYQVQIIATDELYDSDPVTIAIPSDSVYMDRPSGGKSMALGGYSTGQDIFDVYWRTKARGGISVFDEKGTEIPLDGTMPLPRDQIKGTWNPNELDCGVYVVTDSSPLKSGENVIMYNGVLLQMKGTVEDNVILQFTFPVDGNKSPMYRVCWYSNWSDWRSMKL